MPGSRWFGWGCAFVALMVLILLGQTSAMATLVLGTWLPLPLLLVGRRWGTGSAILLAFAAAAALVALNPTVAALQDQLGLWLLFLLGILLTYGHQRGWAPGSAIMVAALAVGLVFVALMGVTAFIQGLTPSAFWAQKSKKILHDLNVSLRQSGFSLEDLRLLGLPSAEMETLLVRILPSLALVNTALVAWLNVLVAERIARRQGWGVAAEPLARWSSPEWLVFVLVAGGFALLAPPLWVRTVGLNLLLVVAFAYFCQGLAVIAAFLQRYQAPLPVRGLIYVLAFVNPLLIMVMLLGLADLWLDFRRLQPPREA